MLALNPVTPGQPNYRMRTQKTSVKDYLAGLLLACKMDLRNTRIGRHRDDKRAGFARRSTGAPAVRSFTAPSGLAPVIWGRR